MTSQTLPTLPIVARTRDGYAAGNSRLRSDIRKGLAMFLFTYSQGRCVVCGQAVVKGGNSNAVDAFNIGHLVPGGAGDNGWQAGNVATMCRACNAAIRDTDVSGMIAQFAFPQGIPTAWPTNSEMIALGKSEAVTSTHDIDAAAIRKANGLPF